MFCPLKSWCGARGAVFDSYGCTVTGCVAVALSQLTNAIVAHRRARFGGDPGTMRSCVLFDCLLACLAAGATTLLAPGAAGSGIPVVKAYLNGVRVRGCLSPKCFLVKFFGKTANLASTCEPYISIIELFFRYSQFRASAHVGPTGLSENTNEKY